MGTGVGLRLGHVWLGIVLDVLVSTSMILNSFWLMLVILKETSTTPKLIILLWIRAFPTLFNPHIAIDRLFIHSFIHSSTPTGNQFLE